jgi:hypothetical protein
VPNVDFVLEWASGAPNAGYEKAPGRRRAAGAIRIIYFVVYVLFSCLSSRTAALAALPEAKSLL